MRKAVISVTLVFLIGSLLIAQNEDDSRDFGIQPALVSSNIDPKLLIKRVLGLTQYKLTPGDAFEFSIKLEDEESITLVLSTNYEIEIPYVGTLAVRGMYYDEFRSQVISSIKKRLNPEFVDLVLVSPALFDIFVYGGVNNPGIVTVTSLNRVTDALALAKGTKKGSSYRQVRLYRESGAILCDLSRFVKEADLDANPVLEPGDKIYVPHLELAADISGNVIYPDTYELISGETLSDLVQMAGGTAPGAENFSAEVRRIAGGEYAVLTVSPGSFSDFPLKNGDRVMLPPARENPESILLEGAVFGKPLAGDEPSPIPAVPILLNIPYREGMTLLELLERFGGPTPLADPGNGRIERSGGGIAFDVNQLWSTRDPNLDVPLKPGDRVFIPMKNLNVAVAGNVNLPGTFPYVSGSKVSHYIAAAGGIDLDMGNPDRIILIDETAQWNLVDLETSVTPGTVIYVDKKPWEHTRTTLSNVLVVTGFVSSLISLTVAIIELINMFP